MLAGHAATNCLWMFCMSGRLMSIAEAQEVMDPEYDAVAVIHDPWCFGHLLAHEVRKYHPIADEFWVKPIVYREREYPYDQDDGLDPACIKPLRYSRQTEVRFIYASHQPLTQAGMLLGVPSLVAHCRILQGEEIPKYR